MTVRADRTAREAFAALWRRIGASTDAVPVYAFLVHAYAEPHRRYHTLDHIASVLAALDATHPSLTHPDAAEAALWFHDVVYDTHAIDSEAQSAARARTFLESAGVSPNRVARVVELILATTHTATPKDPDARYVVDIDLSILGAGEEEFDRYEWQIRQEYGWVPELTFRERRAALLRKFLDRPTIFLTPEFRHLESPARANLTRSLAHLGPDA